MILRFWVLYQEMDSLVLKMDEIIEEYIDKISLTLFEHVEELFQVIDIRHVQYSWCLLSKEKTFCFAVYDKRLYYDDAPGEYKFDTAHRLSSFFVPLPDFRILSECINYFDVNSNQFHYYRMNINGGMPGRYHLVKRLKTELRMIKIRVEDMPKAYDLICSLVLTYR